MKQFISFLLLGLIFCAANAQVYIEKQTRHRFAQLHLGVDGQVSIGGETRFVNPAVETKSLRLNTVAKPRFTIGGTHFWIETD